MRRSMLPMLLALAGLTLVSAAPPPLSPPPSYYDNSRHPDAWAGGARKIMITTPKGPHQLWIKRVGNNPKLKLLLLTGGPGLSHAYLEVMDSFLPGAGIEYYHYDQLETGDSDRPDDDSLWTLARYVDEVDQVRRAIGGDKSNFCVLGHSWGGVLAIEYALAHQDQLKCLVISNMMASIPAYNAYARDVLEPKMDQKVLRRILEMEASGKTEDPAYMALLQPNWYEQHILRRPSADWPEPVERAGARLNRRFYVTMQGPSEMGASGRLVNWDRFADLKRIRVPTLVVSGAHDTMDPAYMARMAKQLPHGELLATNGGHMAMYDDQPRYFAGLTRFMRKMNQTFSRGPSRGSVPPSR
ncbi:proline iminopeptidase-family hydrolase [Sphingomonas sp.]|uniref:proline iminopeptidase-family hydrolase n=1 Tax=Sphingomonas sp. TaxID=28214 RepID=UPI00325FD6DF